MMKQVNADDDRMRKGLRDGLTHIRSVAQASRTQTHRIRYIIAKANELLDGTPIPKGRLPNTQADVPTLKSKIKNLENQIKDLKKRLRESEHDPQVVGD